MSTTERIAASEWIAGREIIGDTGGGVRGSSIPQTGGTGGSIFANDIALPADANKEICGRVTRWPTAGVLFLREDGSFTWPYGSDSFDYQLFVDYVPVGPTVSVSLSVGAVDAAVAGITLTAAATLLPGAASGTGSATVAGRTLAASTSLTPGAATATGAAAVPGTLLAAVASLLAGTASAGGAASVPGQTLTAVASVIAGRASGNQIAFGSLTGTRRGTYPRRPANT